MGPMNLYFDVRDIFRAPRLALSGKKIFIFLIGLISGWIAYWLLTHVALGLAGISFASAPDMGYFLLGLKYIFLYGQALIQFLTPSQRVRSIRTMPVLA